MFRKKRKLRYKINYGYSKISKKSKKRSPAIKRLMNKKPSKVFAKLKKYLVLMTSLSAIILGIYWLFFSNYLTIEEITVEENTENTTAIISEEIMNCITNSIGENIFFIDTKEFEYKILERFPGIEEVNIKKDYPHTITVSFSEFAVAANIINESQTIKKTFVINSMGYAVKENVENPSLPYIRIKSDEPINTENPVISSNKLKFILETKTYFEDKFGMRITEIQYKKTARELHLITENNFSIWLDIEQPAEDQLKKLKKALIKLDIYTESLEYIDLRIAGNNGDKIIYKRR